MGSHSTIYQSMKKTGFFLFLPLLISMINHNPPADGSSIKEAAIRVLRSQVMEEADWALNQEPVTVTAESSPRSAGGKHDFFSEGDYWWPNPVSPDSPYVTHDGMTNPNNFTAHRYAMIRFSRIVGALASAYRLTHDTKYLQKILLHCKAWFADTATRMNPSLLYAQAVRGRFTGRGIGVIDTIQLMEVAQALYLLENEPGMDPEILLAAKNWFSEYITWLTTHPYGVTEMNALNNHGTCWVMQVACFARFTGNKKMLQFCSDRCKTKLIPEQIEPDGSLLRELKRTKPYGYSLFNMDAFATICQILSTKEDDLWHYQTPDGRSVLKCIANLFPYIADKTKWPHKQDVMYWNDWPVAQPALLFGANVNDNQHWFSVWAKLNHAPEVEEIIRNLPVRHPLIWLP